ncbi:MAG: restriction endonuclease subunit S, partial [Synechococcus sp.]|nr:restriction endonuclease subunit S [Synechococcus sp.]
MSRVITHIVNCALVPNDLGPANCANVVLVRPGQTIVPEFLAHFIRSPAAQKYLMDRKVGSAQLVVNTTVVKEWPVPIPPLPEQQRIVALLDEAFAGLATAKANAERNLQSARAIFESYLESVLTEGGDTWEEKTLGNMCAIARGGSPRPINEFITEEAGGINWIKISDATSSDKYIFKTAQKIRPDGASRSRMVHDGDFILSNSMSFGRPYIMRTSGCIHDGWLVLAEYAKSFEQDYLYYLLGSRYVYRQFDALAAGSTVRNLNIELASRVTLPVPPLEVQQNIARQIEALEEEIHRLTKIYERKLASLEELKKSLLQKAFNGEL